MHLFAGVLGQPWGDALYSQTFDAGSVGTWKVVGITAEAIALYGVNGDVYSNSGTSATPTYSSSGGNTGGYMSASDPDAPTYGIDGTYTASQELDFYTFDAGSDFIPTSGGWPARAYEGVLQFDYKLNASPDLVTSYAITPGRVYLKGVSSNNVSFPWPASQPKPTTSWQTITIYLSEKAGWTLQTNSGPSATLPTTTQFKNVLTGITRLRIPGDWLQTTPFGANSIDASQIDNVYIRQGENHRSCLVSPAIK